MSRNLHEIIKAEYEKRQKLSHDALEAKKAEVFARVPEIEEVMRSIQQCGLQYGKMILLDGAQQEKALAELDKKLDVLKSKKEWLLIDAGYPADYLETSHTCAACRDTGYIEAPGRAADRCACYRQQMIDLLYERSNLKMTQTENFKSFNEKYYPDYVDCSRYGIDASPRQNILRIKERCIQFINNFDKPEEKNLFFTGTTGIGKTFMSNCIAMELMERGKTVLYQTAPRLFDIINEHKAGMFKEDEVPDDGYLSVFDADLLIIDDLGTEPQSASRYAELLNILNARQNANLVKSCKTIISTNMEPRDLYSMYTERVASRIIGCFDIYKFAGEDIRMLKKLGKNA